MPRKRKSNLSTVSAEARRARLRRALEDKAERAERLLSQRLRSQRSRSLETQEERDLRLSFVRKRSARMRAAKRVKEHQHRTEKQEIQLPVGADAVQKKELQEEPKRRAVKMAEQTAKKRTDSEQKAKRKESATFSLS